MIDTKSPLYEELNKDWKATCRIVLGDEIGELKDFNGWLKDYIPEFGKRKSHVSGKDVVFARKDYCADASFISLDELKERAIEPLTINEIKDIDSLAQAVSEKWEYAGSKEIGNSKFVEESDNIIDSQYVAESANIRKSSHIYSSYFANDGSKYVFGGNWVVNGEFLIKSQGRNVKRTFDNNWSEDCSDAYFSFFNIGCSEIMFCFFQRNRRHAIGNLQLDREKYAGLKRKLLDEVVQELKKSKSFPSIYSMVPNEKPKISIRPMIRDEKGDIEPMRKAFSTTFNVIFKKEPGDMVEYEQWLMRHIMRAPELKSPFGSKVYRSDSIDEFWRFPEKRIISQDESVEMGLADIHMDEPQFGSIESIRKGLWKIGFFVGRLWMQERNCIDCPLAYRGVNMYKVNDTGYSENGGMCGTLLDSKYVFGCNRVVNSQFCIDCYHSFTLNRCFELDACTKCTDSMFSHNCEGLTESMFCFNVKGKRHAIGNYSLPVEQYRKIRDSLVGQMGDEIIKNKTLKWDIYNVGCAK